MGKFLELAFRNIFRNKRRTVITAVTIIVGMVVIIFVSGILADLEARWRDYLIYSSLGHIQIMASGLKDDDTLQCSIPDVNPIMNKLTKYSEIKNVTGVIDIKGLISNGDDTQVFVGNGVDPETYLRTLPKAAQGIKSGHFFRREDKEGVILAEGLARKLHAKVGESLILAANDRNESLNAVNIKVSAIEPIQDSFANDHLLLINIDNARSLTGYNPNEVSKLILTLSNADDSVRFKDLLTKDFPPASKVEVYSWHSLAGTLNSVIGLFSAIGGIITLILLAMTLIGIMNTVLMSVFERTREIGTIMAIGSSPGQVKLLFICESFCIGLFGVAVGIGAGILINSIVLLLGGLHLPPPPMSNQPLLLDPLILPDRIIIVSILVLIASILAALYPASYATKLRPVDALRAN